MLSPAPLFAPAAQRAVTVAELRLRRRELKIMLGEAAVRRADTTDIDRELWAVTQQLLTMGVVE